MNFNPRALNLSNKTIVYFNVFFKKIEIFTCNFFFNFIRHEELRLKLMTTQCYVLFKLNLNQ